MNPDIAEWIADVLMKLGPPLADAFVEKSPTKIDDIIYAAFKNRIRISRAWVVSVILATLDNLMLPQNSTYADALNAMMTERGQELFRSSIKALKGNLP